MTLAFAVGLMIGAAVVVFGRETAIGQAVLLRLHVLAARSAAWLRRRF